MPPIARSSIGGGDKQNSAITNAIARHNQSIQDATLLRSKITSKIAKAIDQCISTCSSPAERSIAQAIQQAIITAMTSAPNKAITQTHGTKQSILSKQENHSATWAEVASHAQPQGLHVSKEAAIAF